MLTCLRIWFIPLLKIFWLCKNFKELDIYSEKEKDEILKDISKNVNPFVITEVTGGYFNLSTFDPENDRLISIKANECADPEMILVRIQYQSPENTPAEKRIKTIINIYYGLNSKKGAGIVLRKKL